MAKRLRPLFHTEEIDGSSPSGSTERCSLRKAPGFNPRLWLPSEAQGP